MWRIKKQKRQQPKLLPLLGAMGRIPRHYKITNNI